jgi:hypothetical protein
VEKHEFGVTIQIGSRLLRGVRFEFSWLTPVCVNLPSEFRLPLFSLDYCLVRGFTMYRLVVLSAVILACASASGEAVELFTNFHYGENVGFPPMQVPYGIYGGLGRGGWNPDAEGMPLKTWPDVPSMMPTGQNPGGFRRFNNNASHRGGSAGNATTANGNPENLNRNQAIASERASEE